MMYEVNANNYPGEYPLTMAEKAKQMGMSLSRFRHVYEDMNLNYQRINGRRRVMFQ